MSGTAVTVPASTARGAAAAGCGLHPNGLLRFAPSVRCRQHPSPGGRHLFPAPGAPGAAGRGLAASRPPRTSYRSAPERVSSHAASFGHMMPGPSGPTTMSTWASVPPETVTASRSALETTSSRVSADSGVQGHRQWARKRTGQVTRGFAVEDVAPGRGVLFAVGRIRWPGDGSSPWSWPGRRSPANGRQDRCGRLPAEPYSSRSPARDLDIVRPSAAH